MFIHPQFDPVFFELGPLAVRWYGLMYMVGFIGGLFICRWRLKYAYIRAQGWTKNDIDDLLFYVVLGVILGGRLGYVLFYKASFYFANPIHIFKIWEGGMSFHGGLLGVGLALLFYKMKNKQRFQWLEVCDFIAPAVPLGIAAGRLGNFINGELWGRVTSLHALWATGFPQAASEDQLWIMKHAAQASKLGNTDFYSHFNGMLPRHPSQLYEMFFEGIVLLVVLIVMGRKKRPVGLITSYFIAGYGIARFCIEYAREPDDYLGLVALHLSLGQWLSIPMILGGLGLAIYSCFRNEKIKI